MIIPINTAQIIYLLFVLHIYSAECQVTVAQNTKDKVFFGRKMEMCVGGGNEEKNAARIIMIEKLVENWQFSIQ